jgi:hypothetical protein
VKKIQYIYVIKNKIEMNFTLEYNAKKGVFWHNHDNRKEETNGFTTIAKEVNSYEFNDFKNYLGYSSKEHKFKYTSEFIKLKWRSFKRFKDLLKIRKRKIS